MILVPEHDRDFLIEDLRKANLDASSWYPSLTNFFPKDGDHNSLPQATAFENQVVNLWVNNGVCYWPNSFIKQIHKIYVSYQGNRFSRKN